MNTNKEKSNKMGKNKEIKEVAIETLLEREKAKNRRIVTAVIFAVGILIGLIGGYFQAVNVITDSQAKAVSVVTVKTK